MVTIKISADNFGGRDLILIPTIAFFAPENKRGAALSFVWLKYGLTLTVKLGCRREVKTQF